MTQPVLHRLEHGLDLDVLERLIVQGLEDVKGHDILVLSTQEISQEFDKLVICTATSNRQTRALAQSVIDKVKENGGQVLSTEGEDTGEWVLVDCGDIVVHVMQAAIRAYYNLEELWGGGTGTPS